MHSSTKGFRICEDMTRGMSIADDLHTLRHRAANYLSTVVGVVLKVASLTFPSRRIVKSVTPQHGQHDDFGQASSPFSLVNLTPLNSPYEQETQLESIFFLF